MKRILVIDDAPEIQLLVKHALGPAYETIPCARLQEAAGRLSEREFDLVLLDVQLPDGDGFDFFPRIRAAARNPGLPVLFLSNKYEASDRVLGYRLGAEDYISKSVDPLELRTRVEARLKAEPGHTPGDGGLRKGRLRFDLVRQAVFERPVGTEGAERNLNLTGTEFRLLLHFARHEEHVLNREQLLAAAWPSGTDAIDRVADVYVCVLRRKLSSSGYTIKPVYGAGYRFIEA